MDLQNPNHPLHKDVNRSVIRRIVKKTLAEMINEETDTSKEFKKIAVKRFFMKLENSSLKNLLKFNTPSDQAEAIVKFAELVGVPKSRVSAMIKGLKDASDKD